MFNAGDASSHSLYENANNVRRSLTQVIGSFDRIMRYVFANASISVPRFNQLGSRPCLFIIFQASHQQETQLPIFEFNLYFFACINLIF